MDGQRFLQPRTPRLKLGAGGPPFLEMFRVSQGNRALPALLCAGIGQSILWPVPVIPGQAGSELAASSPAVGAGGIGGYMTAFDG